MAGKLDRFLERMAATPFEDGVCDCVLNVADWIMACGCPDPAEPWRGRYRTALGRERLLKRNGGLQAVVEAGAERAGLFTCANPVRGDVGLVRIYDQTFAAICLGRGWAIKSSRGLTVVRPETVIKAWRVPNV
ncbi:MULTISPECIES: DUF6950 family protein [unclassified Brevundimonas]|uniref:DUF6950 family protein n=1 Tax=unclassified Brevundimonas TaxID=2622653 RepID=UPI0025C6E54A|nr:MULTISPECIES: hypothetical protein [unclassified Brevundimonas]